MANYDIKPFKGIGNIKFGATPTEVRKILGEEFKSFKRSPTAAFPCDYFPHVGVFAYYTAAGTLEAIEFASPAVPLLDGVNLLSIGLDAAKSLLRGKGGELEEDAGTLIAKSIGISLYAPNIKENPNTPCESILVFADGYYD